jgi:hypothetical protein
MVSMVKRCHQTETHPITFEEIWSVTKSGEHGLKEKIIQIRNRYEAEKDITGDTDKAKKAIADLKLELPGFLPSGTFSKRDSGSLVEYSGLLCADMDSLGDRLAGIREMLKSVPFVRAVALSPSGDGLGFSLILNDPLRHEDSFRSIRTTAVTSASKLTINAKTRAASASSPTTLISGYAKTETRFCHRRIHYHGVKLHPVTSRRQLTSTPGSRLHSGYSVNCAPCRRRGDTSWIAPGLISTPTSPARSTPSFTWRPFQLCPASTNPVLMSLRASTKC